MFKTKLSSATAVLLSVAISAYAGDAEIRKAIMPIIEDAKIESISKTPYLGLYEIRISEEGEKKLLYSDEMGQYIFIGSIIDSAKQENITRKKENALNAIRFSDLPFDLAIKTVRGSGKRVIATFEDPECVYCKKLIAELQNMDNITIYTFLLPILSQSSVDKSRAVWCAPDRSKAWTELMLNNVQPAPGACDAPLKKTVVLAKKLKIRGTPHIILPNGERIPGAMTTEQLEQRLAQIK